MSMIILLYMLIIRYMKRHLFSTNAPRGKVERHRQKREIRLYSRIFILLGMLFTMGVPYCVFFFISMINGFAPVPPYANRICLSSVSIGFSGCMLLSLVYTDDVQQILVRFIRGNHPITRR
jgi:hypothetical protein